jgi:hypothetical protein
MLEVVGREMGAAGAAVGAHEELDRVLEADGQVPGASAQLRAWTGESYRSLRALLTEQDPALAQVGLTKVVSENSGAVEWVAPRNAEAWQRQQRGEGGEGREDEQKQSDGGGGGGGGGAASAAASAAAAAAAAAAGRQPPLAPAAQPPWAEASACLLCGAEFGVVMPRRHHCRQCGKSVCDDCSPGRAALPGLPGLQRVCRRCEHPASGAALSAGAQSQVNDDSVAIHSKRTAYRTS